MATQNISPTHIPSTQAQRKFGDLIRRVFSAKEHVIVEKDGLPVMAIIPMEEYQRYLRDRQERAELSRRFTEAARQIGQEAQRQGYTEEQMMEDMKEIRRQLFREHYGEID